MQSLIGMSRGIRLSRKYLALILLLSLVARLFGLFFLTGTDMLDTFAYWDDGRSLLTSGVTVKDIYMPLFPIWVYLTGGGIGTKIADIILSVITVWVVYRLTEIVFERVSVALVAAFIAALYPHFIFYANARLSETLYLLLTCVVFYFFYKKQFVWGSVVLVASILTRPSIDLFAPILVLTFAIFVHKQSIRTALVQLLKYAIIYVVLMSPWWVHNYAKYGEFVRLNLGDGIVLYSGNNPLNKSGGGVATSTDQDDMDTSQFDHLLDPIEKNRVMKQAAVDFIMDNPGRFMELAAIKFIRFWRLWPYAPDYQKPHIIVASLLSYGVVLALSIVFLFRFGRLLWRPVLPFVLFSGYLTAIHMVSIGSIRYRLPIEPFLIVLAAYAGVWLLGYWKPARDFFNKIETV